MEDYKFLILLFYYNRPEIVKNALKSIKFLEYKNYEVAFINDTFGVKGVDVVNYIEDEEILSKFKYYDVGQTNEEKIDQGGSMFGKFANLSITESDCDIVIMLCDDDALLPDYLLKLNEYYKNNLSHMWAYSKVKYFVPTIENYTQSEDNFDEKRKYGSIVDLNHHSLPLNPANNCDASQVSFRKSCFLENNVWFPFPQTANLDFTIFQSMFKVLGPCYPTNFYGQCKGVFSDQLGGRGHKFYDITYQ